MEGISRSAQNVQDKQVAKTQKDKAAQGAGTKAQKQLKRMQAPKVQKIDYLTPQRKAREHHESLKGDYTVDFAKIV